MVKKIVWTEIAIADRLNILNYWLERLGHYRYSKKIDEAFKEVIKKISEHPEMGSKYIRNIRVFVKGNYLIFYKFDRNVIHVLHIWDSRRNLENLEFN